MIHLGLIIFLQAQVRLDKEAPAAASTLDPKDKLAALREKRRVREAATASSSVTVAATVG
jgi:hypothetical protein